ncbi:putative Pectinesterase inhibitor [Melia azedarach]|uniref:Pectinesterase inhibitor n=1 Tax=Melia azedarach TaxID=155640 RepID=A0ACC1YW12_MELAZ|nr:putative Pectinesterase inhibitor [Melia azedarach]
MKSMTSLILVLPPVLCFCLALQPLATNGADETPANNVTNILLKKVCDSSEDKNLCYSTFNANPDSQNSDLTGLAMIGLKIASKNATQIVEYINKRMNENNLDPMLQQGLTDCSDEYLDAAEQLDDSVAALLADAFKDLKTWVNAAIADAVSCQEAFERRPGIEPVIDFNNGIFLKLCNNILIVNKLLAGQ